MKKETAIIKLLKLISNVKEDPHIKKFKRLDLDEVKIRRDRFLNKIRKSISKNSYLIKDIRIEIDWKQKEGEKDA